MLTSAGSSAPYLLTRYLSNEQNCFIQLPRGMFAAHLQGREQAQGCMTLMMEWKDQTPAAAAAAASTSASSIAAAAPAAAVRRVYVGWMGRYLPDEPGVTSASVTQLGSIGLPAVFATCLGIPPGIRVQVSPVSERLYATPASTSSSSSTIITLEPISPDDWEILELNTGAIEMRLLAQAQVLNPEQTIPFWLGSGGTRIQLRNVTPRAATQAMPFVKLTLHSEISIVPKPRAAKRKTAAAAIPPPRGPPPPIARLRVQPLEHRAVESEVRAQRARAEEESERRRVEVMDARWKRYEEKHGAVLDGQNGAFDAVRRLLPTAPHVGALPQPTVTLTSTHYVHVSARTMRFLGVQTDDLVVIAYGARTPANSARPPAAPIPASVQSMTTVARIAQSETVVDDDAISSDYSSSSPHHILLPAALRLAWSIPAFAWITLQKLTGHNITPSTQASAVRQALCVRETAQRVQNIRLKEIRLRITRQGAASTGGSRQLEPSAPRSMHALEDDARLVSDAFIRYIRESTPSDPSSSSALVPLPVPMVNGAMIELEVPTIPRRSAVKQQPMSRRRFFTVHFNEADLLAAARAHPAGSAAARAGQPPASFLDQSVLSSSSALDSASDAPAGATGGLKLTVATAFFLIRAPLPSAVVAQPSTATSSSSSHKKKKSAPVVAPLPLPVLHVEKIDIEREEAGMEEEWITMLAKEEHQEQSNLTPSLSSSRVSYHQLGISPEFARTVVEPLWKHLKSDLNREAIHARRQALTASDDGADELKTAFSDINTSNSSSVGGLMLVGSSGKSNLLWSIGRLLRSPGNPVGVLAPTRWIDCKAHLTWKVVDFRAMVERTLREAVAALPGQTMIVLEDLDKLMPLAEENDGSASMRATQLAEGLLDALTAFRARYPDAPLSILAICQSAASHHPLLNYAFPHVLTLPSPSAADRLAILLALCSLSGARLSAKVDRALLGRKTEGYSAADLKQLVQRAVHARRNRWMEREMQSQEERRSGTAAAAGSSTALVLHQPPPSLDSSDPSMLDPLDISAAFLHFVPASLKDIASAGDAASANGEQVDWDSIGGMFELKRVLLDTFELPVRYSELFSRAPLKLRSGLLIYGPSGCGKTLLASHIARRCGLNFISVAGPELLNKYIGSSEQNVRDVFTRARAAAPALLFFDEMDSIVPARGGDSTGVTDRVVNQFLCELDGVEGKISGGKQLYVLGASSRPDLIDPALLRPGRLDKSLYCGLPDLAERRDMLRCMIQRMQLAPDVDLDWIAERTDKYTPADLQAIITNAQMAHVQLMLDDAETEHQQAKETAMAEGRPMPARTQLVLTPLHNSFLSGAFADSRPSTSESDRRRYEQIYQRFKLSKEPTDAEKFDPKKQRQAQA